MPDEEEGEEREVRRPKKRHTRRAFLKYLTRVGLGAALWGAGGYLGGKIFGSTVKPVVDTVLGTSKRVTDAYDGMRRLNPFSRKTPAPRQPATRRSFLSSLVRTAYHHPVEAGIAVGATYGTGKYALSGMSKYLTDRQIAKLKDENTDYRERLELLEKYKAGVQKDLKGKDARINYLGKQLASVNEQIRLLSAKSGKLELTAGEGTEDTELSEPETLPLIIGGAGLLISIALSSLSITGNTIFNAGANQMFSANIVIFVISLLLVLFGMRKRKSL